MTQALGILRHKYSGKDSGVHFIETEESVQLVTNPVNRDVVEQFTKSELIGELTKAQLQTLTVIAYRGPVTRPELEQIRGVNCAVIVRNLLLRGLIVEEEHTASLGPTYEVSLDTLRFLGIGTVKDLPEYGSLHAHEHIERILHEEET